MNHPHVIVIGGLDPTGGAGLVRDYLTATELGACATLIASAWTAQSGRGVKNVDARQPAAVRDDLLWALAEFPRAGSAVKIGMIATPAIAHAVVAALEGFAGPVVFDPVLAASSGGSLFTGTVGELAPLVRRASLVAPNLAEARAFAGIETPIVTVEGARAAGRRMIEIGARAVLVKGGHLPEDASDVLITPGGETVFESPRVPGDSPRGTGWALATAIAVGWAGGLAMPDAIARAKSWLRAGIAKATLRDEPSGSL